MSHWINLFNGLKKVNTTVYFCVLYWATLITLIFLCKKQRMGEVWMPPEVCMEQGVGTARTQFGLLWQCLLNPLLSISVILPALFWIHSSTTCARQAQPDSWADLLSWYRAALVQETRSAGAAFYSHTHLYIYMLTYADSLNSNTVLTYHINITISSPLALDINQVHI